MKLFTGDHFEVAGSTPGITRKGYIHGVEYSPDGDKYIVEWEDYPSQRFDYLVKDVEHDWIKTVDVFTARSYSDATISINGKPIQVTDFSISFDADKKCDHDWAEYLGFNDSFTFCKKCDERKR